MAKYRRPLPHETAAGYWPTECPGCHQPLMVAIPKNHFEGLTSLRKGTCPYCGYTLTVQPGPLEVVWLDQVIDG